MKLSLIILFAAGFLLGCGDASESNSTPEDDTVESVPPPPAKPSVPPKPSDDSPVESESNCYVNSYWVNNCLVTKVYCDGKLKRLDIKCRVDHELFPWEYIPDPPPPWVKEK